MALLLISFLAGVLTVLAPCILPLLPIIVGGSVTGGNNKKKSLTIILSLISSVVIFTLLLKWSTALITIPQSFWTTFSGVILVIFALVLIFPKLWDKIPYVAKLNSRSSQILGKGQQKGGLVGDIIIGAALGPVFSTCSPTYFLILATVLPVNFGLGLIYLLAYALGLGGILWLIAIFGQKITAKLGWAADSRGWFKKAIGILFLIVGLAIITGFDKKIEQSILDAGFFDITKVENQLLEKLDNKNKNPETTPIDDSGIDTTENEDSSKMVSSATKESINNKNTEDVTSQTGEFIPPEQKKNLYPQAINFVSPSGYLNTQGNPITISEYIGEKVILVDFMTYSCINCQRTFPYLNNWYESYQDDGLIIIGIHTPEFAFEKLEKNVSNALEKYGIKFPVVLDNNYETWRAYDNHYWPRKYLIDIYGNVVYDHIGEGKYTETENMIKYLLKERNYVLGQNNPIESTSDSPTEQKIIYEGKSPETYIGYARGDIYNSPDSDDCKDKTCSYQNPDNIIQNKVYLEGDWSVSQENATLVSDTGSIIYKFYAKNVHLVTESDAPIQAKIYLDGDIVSKESGDDVNDNGIAIFNGSDLHNLIRLDEPKEHTLEIEFQSPGISAFAFTFG